MQQQPVLYRVLPLVPVELDSGERSVAASSDEVLNVDDQDGLGSNESRREEMEQDMNLLMEQGFVFSDEEEGSSFDPISTMWPRHPDEFAFSQKGDDENEEGSGGLSGDDEAYREGRNQMARQTLDNSPVKGRNRLKRFNLGMNKGVHGAPLDFIAE